MAGPASVGPSTPPWMYAPRPSPSLAPSEMPPANAPRSESPVNQAFDLASKGADLSASVIEQGLRHTTSQLGSRWHTVEEMSSLLHDADQFASWARHAKLAGGLLSAGEVLTAQDPLRAAIKQGFTMAGNAVAAPLGPLGATVSGELIGGTYDKIFFEDIPTLRDAGAGLLHEGGVLADVTREGLSGTWTNRLDHINSVAHQIDAVGEGQGFVRENLADALALGYRGVATLGAGLDYLGEGIEHAGSDAASWLYHQTPTGGVALGGALELGPDDWHGCGGPSTGWIVPDRFNLGALGIDIDATPACQGHDNAWIPSASLNDMTRANVQLGMDIIQGGAPDQSWGESAARGVIGFGYTFATDAVALGSAAWEGATSLWDAVTGGDNLVLPPEPSFGQDSFVPMDYASGETLAG